MFLYFDVPPRFIAPDIIPEIMLLRNPPMPPMPPMPAPPPSLSMRRKDGNMSALRWGEERRSEGGGG